MEYKFVKILLHLLLISKILYWLFFIHSSVPLLIEMFRILFYILLVNYVTVNDLQTTSNHNANNFWTYSINQHILHTKHETHTSYTKPTASGLRITDAQLPWGIMFPSCRWIMFNCSSQFLPWAWVMLGVQQGPHLTTAKRKRILLCRKYRNIGEGCFHDVQWAHLLAHHCEKVPVLVILMEIQFMRADDDFCGQK